MSCRKCNFVLIDVEVELLLAYLASMKAKVRVYPFSKFGCLHVNNLPFFAGLSMRFHRLRVIVEDLTKFCMHLI